MRKLVVVALSVFLSSAAFAETYRLKPDFHYLNFGRLVSPYECRFDLKKSIDFAKPIEGSLLEELELEISELEGSPLRQIELRGKSPDAQINVKFQASVKTADLLVKRWTTEPKIRWFSVAEDVDCASGGAGYSRVRDYQIKITTERRSSF